MEDYKAIMDMGGFEIRFISSDIQPKGMGLMVLHPDDLKDVIEKYKQENK